MQLINDIITQVFDIISLPFSGLSPIWGLLMVSMATGAIMVLIYKYTSNQAAIRRTKEIISAYFLEVRLFKDDLGLVLDAQRRIIRTTLTYMRHSLMPMLVMIVPVILIMIQLGIRYDHRPLKPGESALIKLKFAGDDSVERVPVSVKSADGLRIETPLLRIPAEQEIDFRIMAVKSGEQEISINVGEEQVLIPVIVSDNVERVYPVKRRPSFVGEMLAPGQSSLPRDSRLDEIRIAFPVQALSLLGWRANWLVIFFVASIAAGFLFKGPFKVDL